MQAQDRWDDFTERKYQMLKRTGTLAAPWTIIRSGDKQRARLNAMKVILNAVDYPDRNLDSIGCLIAKLSSLALRRLPSWRRNGSVRDGSPEEQGIRGQGAEAAPRAQPIHAGRCWTSATDERVGIRAPP
jgi:Uncharacterized conserved protein